MSGLSALVRKVAAAAFERRWIFAVPVATLLAPAALYVVRLPDTYTARVGISVRQVNAERVGVALPTMQDFRPEQILATARDRVLQAPNVAAMVPVLWPKGNPKDDWTIERARARVMYDQAGDARFSLSIVDTSPARAAEAVNTLVDAFIENERAARVAVVERRRDFLEAEAGKAREAFDAVLAEKDAFRRAHPDTMPDQRETITSDLHRIEQEMRERENDAQRNRLMVPEVDKWMKSAVPAAGTDAGRASLSADEQMAQLKLTSAQAALDQASRQLAELRVKYTDSYDRVQLALAQVQLLEGQVTRAKDELDAAKKRADADTSSRRRADNQELMASMRTFRDSLVAEEKAARAAVDELRARAADLSRRLGEIPATADALRKLQTALEGADQTRLRAEEAARNARVAADFYRNADPAETVGFAVESRAIPPVSPSGPSRTRWLASAVALGLGIGYGLHVLRRRYVDEDVVADADDLADLVPGALVVSVPMLGAGPARRRGAWVDLVCGAWVVVCIGVTAFALGCHRGWIETPSWFRPFVAGRS
ncbi:MAG: hypothetical protein JNM10_16335 [Planctomycetia bacterium]|nr:hypothetical protein [Planctomycetia bacterium]